MLYLVRWDVDVPDGFPKEELDPIMTREREYSRRLRSEGGPWKSIWRVAGQRSTVSIFDVASHDELHDAVTQLPMYRFLKNVEVVPLATHPATKNV